MSQLALALEAGISTRHLCFLEKGKSLPSREMVALLSQVLDIPLSERNALLMAAGYAPAFNTSPLDAPALLPAQRTLDFILAQQEPYPALVLDEGWNIRRRNKAAARIFGSLRAQYDMPDDLAQNVMHVLCHPRGMRPFMLNWEEFAGEFVRMLHRDAALHLNNAAARLHGELLQYPGMPLSAPVPAIGDRQQPMVAMRLRHESGDLSFLVTMTSFAMPRDVTLQQIRIESFYPADEATAAIAGRLAAD